jgi:hypothetical protein
MLDFLFTLGQAASVLLLIYGAYLVMPWKPSLAAERKEELLVLRLDA